MAMTTEEKTAYKRKYNEENYARIGLYISPELKAKIAELSKSEKKSMNEFIIAAIEEKIKGTE